MNILAFDTSSQIGVVGLWPEGKEPIASSFVSTGDHSVRLLPAIAAVLKEADMDLAEIDLFGVVTGPGSFTGLRVGVATANGFAWAHDKPIVGINSLEVLSANVAHSASIIAPMLDARKGRVYAALFRAGETLEVLSAASDVDPLEFLRQAPQPALCLGSGARRYLKEIRETFGEGLRFAAEEEDRPRGEVLVRLARATFEAGKTPEVRRVDPVYLRASEAEIRKGAYA